MSSRTYAQIPAFGLAAVLVTAGCAGAGENSSGAASLGNGGEDSTGGQTSVTSTITASLSATSGETTTTGTDATTNTTTTSTSATSVGVTTAIPPATDSGETTIAGSTTSEPESWNRYTLDVAAGTWSTTALDQLWTGANAPPPFDIAAAASLTHFDRLYVVAADGMFYEQSDGVWIQPTTVATRFPMAAGLDIGSMVHTPGQKSTTQEDIYLIDNPTAVIYVQHANGGLDFAQTAALTDEPGAAPQGSGRAQWAFAITDPSQIGMDADWLQWFMAYDDGNLWSFNAAFVWTSAPLTDNAFFTGAGGEPDPMTIEAAYYDDTFERAHFIGP